MKSKTKTKTLIHATFADGTIMLFLPREKVWVCDWMDESGEYFSGEEHGFAKDLIEPKYHVIDRDGYGPKAGLTNAKIAKVITVPEKLPKKLR